MATLQTGSIADVDACSDNELVDVGNHKNEARLTFTQIHQYLQYGTYPSDFQKSDKQALWKRSKFFKSADGNLYYVGRGKLGIATCLLPHYLFSVLSYFILQQNLTLVHCFRMTCGRRFWLTEETCLINLRHITHGAQQWTCDLC